MGGNGRFACWRHSYVIVHIGRKLFLRGKCVCDVKFDQKHVTPEKRLDVSVHEFLVLKLRRCLKPDNYGNEINMYDSSKIATNYSP